MQARVVPAKGPSGPCWRWALLSWSWWIGYQLFSRADAPDVSPGPVRETEQAINPNPPASGVAGGSLATGAPMWDIGSSTHDVNDPGEGVGTADGRSVVVLPGGALAPSRINRA